MINTDELLSRTVDSVIALHPGAIHVLNAHGIDTCCGGRARLEDAATLAHVEPAVLLASIEAAVRT